MSRWELVFAGANYEVNVLAAVLDAEGIPVEVIDDSAYGSLMGARLLVPATAADRARELIDQGLNSPPEGNYN